MKTLLEEYFERKQPQTALPWRLVILLRKLGLPVRYYGQLYKPYRLHDWANLYDEMRDGTPEQRRQARLQQLPRSWDHAFDAAMRFWRHRCAVCGKDDQTTFTPVGHGRVRPNYTLQRDHIVPISHRLCPGTVPSNMLLLCSDCNRKKYSHDLAQWMENEKCDYLHIKAVVHQIWDWQEQCWSEGWR